MSNLTDPQSLSTPQNELSVGELSVLVAVVLDVPIVPPPGKLLSLYDHGLIEPVKPSVFHQCGWRVTEAGRIMLESKLSLGVSPSSKEESMRATGEKPDPVEGASRACVAGSSPSEAQSYSGDCSDAVSAPLADRGPVSAPARVEALDAVCDELHKIARREGIECIEVHVRQDGRVRFYAQTDAFTHWTADADTIPGSALATPSAALRHALAKAEAKGSGGGA